MGERVRVNCRRKSRSGVESSIYEHRLIPREFYPQYPVAVLARKAIGHRETDDFARGKAARAGN